MDGEGMQLSCSSRAARDMNNILNILRSGADLGGGCRGCASPPEMTCGFLIQLVFCKKKTMWFIGVEVEQETSAPPPKKNPGSALVRWTLNLNRSDKKVKTKNRHQDVLFWLFFSCFVFSDFHVSDFSTLFFFPTCQALKTWFELSRVEL